MSSSSPAASASTRQSSGGGLRGVGFLESPRPARNAGSSGDRDVAAPDSRVRILVVAAREELAIAREALGSLRRLAPRNPSGSEAQMREQPRPAGGFAAAGAREASRERIEDSAADAVRVVSSEPLSGVRGARDRCEQEPVARVTEASVKEPVDLRGAEQAPEAILPELVV